MVITIGVMTSSCNTTTYYILYLGLLLLLLVVVPAPPPRLARAQSFTDVSKDPDSKYLLL